jgi:hypothetical protein
MDKIIDCDFEQDFFKIIPENYPRKAPYSVISPIIIEKAPTI